MANYTIIGGDQKPYGPIPETQLRQWIADGRANAQSQVQVEGATDWKSLADLPEFQDVFKSSTPPPLPAAPVTVPKTSRLAITSLVLGILGVFTCGLTALVGLILGIVAMVKIKHSRGALGGHSLALAGTIVSGIFLALLPVFAILGAMLLPALAAAKQKAQEINCVNNEKQLSLAMRIYAGDNGNHFPPAATWCDAIHTAAGAEKIFKCPAVTTGSRCDYAFNVKLDGLEEGSVNPRTVVLFEAAGGWNASGGPELMIGQARHARMFVVALADGSVHQFRQSELGTLRWDP
jgi:type II secretory pathway pseudopilin PulG